MFEEKIGPELELLVLDENFKETNRADEIIEEAIKRGLPVVAECSKCMVELNSKEGIPLECIPNLGKNLESLNEIVREKGLYILPIEAPLNLDFKPEMRTSPRYSAKAKLLGPERFQISGKVLGFHAHYDLDSNDLIKAQQINFLTLMDPLAIALTASSPHAKFSSWRTHSYRHVVHEGFPFQGQLQEPSPSYQQYLQRLEEEFTRFITFAETRDANFKKCSNKYNAVWGPVRVNPKYQTGEIRSMGANPNLTLDLATAILFLGGMRNIKNNEEIESQYLQFLLNTEDPNESFNALLALSNDATKYGLKTEGVRNYSAVLFDYCVEGLSPLERKFVQEIYENIQSGENFSVKMQKMPQNHREKYHHLHDIYLQSIKKLKEYGEM